MPPTTAPGFDFLRSASLTLFAWSSGIPHVSGIMGSLLMHNLYTMFAIPEWGNVELTLGVVLDCVLSHNVDFYYKISVL